MATYKILGITDDFTACEKCGKTNLKRTVAISIDGADPVYYGTTCAAKAIAGNNYRGTVEDISALAKAIEYAQKWIAYYNEKGADATKEIANAINTRFAVSAHVVGHRVIALVSNGGNAWVNWQGALIDNPKLLF